MAVLSYYQFQFGSLVFGAGTPFVVTDISGLEDLPAIRNQDDIKGYNDGMFTGRDFYGGRSITFTLNVLAGNGNTAQTNFNLFQAALVPQSFGTSQLSFWLSPSDTPKVIYGRVRGRATLVNPEYTYGLIRTQVTLFCPDPRYYDATTTSAPMAPTAAAGRTYNRTYNLVYGGGSQTGTVIVTNLGWATTYPTVTINGPITNPTITSNSTNQFITINTTLAAADSLVIDLNNRLVTLNGSPVRNLMAGNSQWFGCPPGNTGIGLSGTSTTIGVTAATLTYSSAYV